MLLGDAERPRQPPAVNVLCLSYLALPLTVYHLNHDE